MVLRVIKNFGTGDHADDLGFEIESDAVDLAALRRDDALIEAIRGDGVITTTTAEEYELASLLASWRDEINSSPVPLGPTSEQAEQALWAAQRSGRGHGGGRPRLLAVVAGAAAVALMMGGLSIAAHDAQPGDPLWGVNQTLFRDHARSIATVAQVRSDLDEAERLISAGDLQQAQAVLSKAHESMTETAVTESSDRDELASWLDRLQELVARQPITVAAPPATTIPPATTTIPAAAILVNPGLPATKPAPEITANPGTALSPQIEPTTLTTPTNTAVVAPPTPLPKPPPSSGAPTTGPTPNP